MKKNVKLKNGLGKKLKCVCIRGSDFCLYIFAVVCFVSIQIRLQPLVINLISFDILTATI